MLPRWRSDGTKNPFHIQQLKRKMGNVSNASSETELRGALLVQHAPTYVADAFCAGRLVDRCCFNTGTLPNGLDCAAIIERARPVE